MPKSVDLVWMPDQSLIIRASVRFIGHEAILRRRQMSNPTSAASGEASWPSNVSELDVDSSNLDDDELDVLASQFPAPQEWYEE